MNSKMMNIITFCDVHGVSDTDRATLVKIHSKSEDKTYDDWYADLSEDFDLGKIKTFKSQKTEKPATKPVADKSTTKNK